MHLKSSRRGLPDPSELPSSTHLNSLLKKTQDSTALPLLRCLSLPLPSLPISQNQFSTLQSDYTPPPSMADWTQLPTELLQLISNHLNSDFYLIRFRSVCSTWRSSTPFPNPNHHHQKLPSKLPLLSNSINDPNSKSTTFSLSKRTHFLIYPPPQNQTLHPKTHRYHAPWVPWIIKINNSNNQLLNPLSHSSPLPRYFPPGLDFNDLSVVELGHEFVLDNDDEFFSLPHGVSFNNLFLEKIVLFEIERSFALLTIQVSGKLAVFRLGDDRWTIVPEMRTSYDDVCVFKGKPIAVDGTGRTVRVGVGVGTEPEVGFDLVAGPVFEGDKKYLVESNGELLLVDKHMSRAFDDDSDSDSDDDYYEYDDDNDNDNDDDDDGEVDDDGDDNGVVPDHNYGVEWVVKFVVYRLDEKEKRWVKLTNLKDMTLFLGDDCAFSLSASDLGSSCFGNCVVFRDDAFHRFEFEMAVFDLGIRQTTPLQKDYRDYYHLFMPPKWAGSR